MKIDLKDYFTKRSLFNELSMKPGPVLTISRQFGCGAEGVAEKLINRLNVRDTIADHSSWEVISKEILYQAADELRMEPKRLEENLTKIELGVLNEIWNSFSHEWQVSMPKITKTIGKIVESYGYKGHMIILGMGGCVLTHDIEQSLHIRFVAPLEWRVERIYKSRGLSEDAAVKFIKQQDKRRKTLLAKLSGREYDSSLFDAVLNRATLSCDQILEIITGLMREKNMLIN